MKRSLALALLLLSLALSTTVHAQGPATTGSTPTTRDSAYPTPEVVREDFYRVPSYGIGLMVGLLSGAGLSGRATFPGGFAAQATFFVITAFGYTHFNIGGEAQYAFIRKSDWRLYSMLGMGVYSSTSSDSTLPGQRIANPFRMGLGIGYEYFMSEQFVFSFGGAITYFPSTAQVLPIPEAGFYFYFR